MISKTVLIRNKGAIFCQVARTRQESQGRPAITLGNQKWKGKSPILTIRPARRITTESGEEGNEGSQVKEVEELNKLPKIRSPDPKA